MNKRSKSRADMPLLRWQAELWAARARRRKLRSRATAISLGIAALAATIALPPRPRLVWNASASAPVGLYAVGDSRNIRVGDMVIAQVPDASRRLGAERHYIPANVPLVKRVAAVPGDTTCALGQAIFVNGRPTAQRLAADGQGRPMPWWSGCTMLRDGSLLLLMDRPASFDGRYFGPTKAGDVIGKARPLWTR